ncbi:MAG: hypothetical protein MJ252_31210, partial [archaeon]|nr:hypothetical protein [archaeon]
MNPQNNPFFLQPQENSGPKSTTEETKGRINSHMNNKKLTLRKQKVDKYVEKIRNIFPINFSTGNIQTLYGQLAELLKSRLLFPMEPFYLDDQSLSQVVDVFRRKQIVADLNRCYEAKNVNDVQDILAIYDYFISMKDYDLMDMTLFTSNDNLNVVGQITKILNGDIYSDSILAFCIRILDQIGLLKTPVITKCFNFTGLTLLLLNTISKIQDVKTKVSVYSQLFLILGNYIQELRGDETPDLDDRLHQIGKEVYETNLLAFVIEILKNYHTVVQTLDEKEKISLLDILMWFLSLIVEFLDILEMPEYKNAIEVFLGTISEFSFLYTNSNDFKEGQSADNLRDFLDVIGMASETDDNTTFLLHTNIFMKLTKLMDALYQNRNLRRVKVIMHKETFAKVITCFNHFFAADDKTINEFFTENIPTIFVEILKKYRMTETGHVHRIQKDIISCLSNFAAIRENERTKSFFL